MSLLYLYPRVCSSVLQVVDFIVTLVQRACVGLDRVTEPSPENPIESQTLSMGMGLVATLLSGPEVPQLMR